MLQKEKKRGKCWERKSCFLRLVTRILSRGSLSIKGLVDKESIFQIKRSARRLKRICKGVSLASLRTVLLGVELRSL